ncbi:Pkinase-domain-containing protein [Dacryopinax primogenitus]|uniref:cyclin-dependent kinase n=1 Tax=Dacryopinax primogenitus (strain DJM 731) TaxID=1858805 RepID=M5G1C6_DACPD|nr:Pkinase-domain-containing protein [Dacryopinax primogenitus]EJU04036.1 Pkinase-domain-containing protein [Dacryopinax primogenitus]
MSAPQQAESSSAGRKRSKWESLDEADEPTPRRVKIKRPKREAVESSPLPNSVSSLRAGTSTPPSRSPRLVTAADSSRSRYVPRRSLYPPIAPCRSVYTYERLNHIEEGSYGVVFRARDRDTGDIVALKKLKLDQEKGGFPITSLREVMALMTCRHKHVVPIREIVVGDTLTQIFIVMDFIEHDLKTLLTVMPTPFLQSEIKTLLLQLLSAVAHCHANWVLHRDLKTSNLLMNNRGQIKVADFGLARTFGDPLGKMTELVVTLWYRAPELLLGAKTYSTAIDVWSVGCIFGELLLNEPLFQAKGEIEMLSMISKLLGPPTEQTWPGVEDLPLASTINWPARTSSLRSRFPYITEAGLDLLDRFLTYDPEKRISAEEAMGHPYFSESPLPKHPDLFGSFPSIAAGENSVPFCTPTDRQLPNGIRFRLIVADPSIGRRRYTSLTRRADCSTSIRLTSPGVIGVQYQRRRAKFMGDVAGHVIGNGLMGCRRTSSFYIPTRAPVCRSTTSASVNQQEFPMAQYLAQHTTEACCQAVKHTGTPRGELIDVGGVQTYITYPPDKSTDRVIIFYCDVYGPHFLNNQLVMDFFAEHGYTVISPDYFNGEQLEKLREQPGFDTMAWAAPYRVSVPKFVVDKFLPAVKEKFTSVKAYASVGYCFGAPMVLNDLVAGRSEAGAVAHPSTLTEQVFRDIKKPIFLSCAEVDRAFPPESRHKAEAILAEGKKIYHFQLFSGVSHGFAIKGDMNNENERWAKEQSAWGIISWFDRFLKK